MKRHLHHKEAPSSLAPKILAALAAGAFTLGAAPAAYADPIVAATVTTDTVTNDGVAGSTDGTAATITVGTTGGGAAPEIYYPAGGNHRGALVAGAWRKVSLTDGTIDFTGANAGGTALIKSGTFGAAAGAYAWLTQGGTAQISGARTTVKGGVMNPDSSAPQYQRGIVGGLAVIEDSAHSAALAKTTVTQSKVTIEGGSFTAPSGGKITFAGGAAYTNVDAASTNTLITNNTATITGGIFTTAPLLYGGYADIRSSVNATPTVHLTGNTAEARWGKIAAAYGAYASIQQKNGAAQIFAEQNTATARVATGTETFAGARIDYERTFSATALGNVTLKAKNNKAVLTDGTLKTLWGAKINVRDAFGGAAVYEATENIVTIAAEGTVTDEVRGGCIEQDGNSAAGASYKAVAAKNRIVNTGGNIKRNAVGGKVELNTWYAGDLYGTLTENAITGTGGTWAGSLRGAEAQLNGHAGAATAAVAKNRIDIENGTMQGVSAWAGTARVFTTIAGQKATAAVNENTLHLKNASGKFSVFYGGDAYAQSALSGAAAEANANVLTMEGGTFTTVHDATGGFAYAKGKNAPVTASASKNTVTLSTTAPWQEISGGEAEATAVNAAGTATARENTVNLIRGTYQNVFGGSAVASGTAATALAEKNTINISGGTYQDVIYAGDASAGSGAGSVATVRDNKIVITGTPNLSAAQLYGHYAEGVTKNIAGNALVIKETKGITAKSIEGFQKLEFWLPAGMTRNDTMLTVTSSSNTNLGGTAVTAHLRGDETAKRLRLLHTTNAQITTNTATTMNVFKGVSDATVARIGITKNKKELIIKVDGSAIDDAEAPQPKPPTPQPKPPAPQPKPPTPQPKPPAPQPKPPTPQPKPPTPQPKPPTPQPKPPTPPPTPDFRGQIEDNRKSIVETMTGSAAFLRAGADLFAGAGIASASIQTAGADDFTAFAAISGASMRYETGSYVEMRGMNLAVGFARALRGSNGRLLFGPMVEYGRGNYDSYVNDAHGDGSVRYVGGGAFVRQEQKGGMFYEGSLRFGRADMDYAADLPTGRTPTHTSYDTDTNYFGAHLGLGQRITEQSGSERELYVRYFYTRQNGTDATLSTGERYCFDAAHSHRLRAGARWKVPQKGGALILGAAAQYEFGGETDATVEVGGRAYDTPAPTLKGFSGSLELGWKASLSENATADISVTGWAGKQRGVSVRAGFTWKL